jgi:hypothetical protein
LLPAYYELKYGDEGSGVDTWWDSFGTWKTLMDLCEGKARDLSDGKLIEFQVYLMSQYVIHLAEEASQAAELVDCWICSHWILHVG